MTELIDLRGMPYMPLQIERLQRSRAWLICKRRPELAFFMINVWMASWGEVPCGSMEDDDDVLADAACCDPRRWPSIRGDVMRGWVRREDGRLHHPVVQEIAADTWSKRVKWRDQKRGQRGGQRKDNAARPHDVSDGHDGGHHADPPADNARTTPIREGNGKGREQDSLASLLSRLVAEADIDATKHPVHAGPISTWLAMGCDFETDVLETIRSIAARPNYKPPRGLEYFAKAVTEAKDRRLANGAAPLRYPKPTAADLAAAEEHQRLIAEAAKRAN